MKILIVYYSRTGTTKKVAEKIRGGLNCDIEEIIPVKNHKGILGFFLCGKESTQKILPTINLAIKNPADYDLIILGTPIWALSISSPMRAYLENNKEKFKKLAFFCTMGGTGNEQVCAEIEKICGKKTLTRMALQTKEAQSKESLEKIEGFIKSIIRI